MNIEKIKSQNSSNSNLIFDSKLDVQKQNTKEDPTISDDSPNKKKHFYIIELIILALNFSNSIACYIKTPKSLELLISSTVFFGFMCLLCMFFYLLDLRLKSFQKFSHPFLYFFCGLGLVFTDPEVLWIITNKDIGTYFPSLLQIILVFVLQSSVQTTPRLYIFSIILGVLSFSLSLAPLKNIPRTVYLLITLILVCAKLKKQPKHHKKIRTTTNKTEVLTTYRGEQLPKNLDDQDRLFIEQSCFSSLANLIGPSANIIKLQEKSNFSYGVSELIGVLSQIGKNWNFDTFFISDCTGKEPIQIMGLYTIRRYGLDELCCVPENIIKNLLRKLEQSYKSNPYHNSMHAADVMSSYIYFVNNSDMLDAISSIEMLGGIIATLSHDVGHPGKTNRFLVLTRDDIAIAYNDISVLENMHTSIVFSLLKIEDCNILMNFNSEKWLIIRKCIIDMILATDMSKHFDMMAQFRVKYHEAGSIDFTNNEIRSDLFKLLMKAADIGHAAKSTELHERWCRLVVEEFYIQGDMEKSLGISVSMYCDRETTDISKSQAGFIRNIVYPLFSTINAILVSEKIETSCVSQLKTNELYWVMRRKTIRGSSLISRREEYINNLNSLKKRRNAERKPSLPDKYIE
ncbi:hypothetical protein SteCoe_8412 [Stentor coeruleus]|uniref:Phosphodiesterase n=1 Tax=Stentor coeruleus TaxID=5963 RepID=A0A1R2CK46_9CILI|nr:hypothetical protein SteCoe_8412 [Stentor coeruleus]